MNSKMEPCPWNYWCEMRSKVLPSLNNSGGKSQCWAKFPDDHRIWTISPDEEEEKKDDDN